MFTVIIVTGALYKRNRWTHRNESLI